MGQSLLLSCTEMYKISHHRSVQLPTQKRAVAKEEGLNNVQVSAQSKYVHPRSSMPTLMPLNSAKLNALTVSCPLTYSST